MIKRSICNFCKPKLATNQYMSKYDQKGNNYRTINVNIQFQWKQINKKIKCFYLSPIDKPIQSTALNSIVELSAQTMHYPFLQWSISSELSIVLGAMAFRVLIQFASKLFQDMKLKNFKERFLYKVIQKMFLVDLSRDIKFYQIDHRKAYLMRKYYTAGHLVKNFITFYLNLNFLRGCHYLLTNEQYFSFHIHTMFLPTLNSHDPNFLLPLVPICLTYLWISGSRHPFFMHLARKQNFLYRINVAFMSGLFCVPIPCIYTLSCIGLLTSHLLIRRIYHQRDDLSEEWRNVFGFNKKFNEQKEIELKKAQITQISKQSKTNNEVSQKQNNK